MVKDDCLTAPDVWRKIAQVRAFRKRMMPEMRRQFIAPRPPPEPPVKKPKPKPKPLSLRIETVTVVAPPVPYNIPLGMRGIVNAISDYYDLPRMKVFSQSRAPEIVNVRHMMFLLIKVLLRKSTPETAQLFRRDHTTVMHGLHKYPWTLVRLQYVDRKLPMPELIRLAAELMHTEGRFNRRPETTFPKVISNN